MSTTRGSRRRLPAVVTSAALVGLGLFGLAGFGSVDTPPPRAADVVTTTTTVAPAPIVEVERAATAVASAKRVAINRDKPIFPMQTKPHCYILDNFGDPRSGGRTHEGTDMLADLGQEVYAVVDGTLSAQVINGQPGSELSGNAWRLTVTGGKTYYVFMHLSAFADGLHNGSVVAQGQVIGYVGDTGNPGPGNYHLHFEVHPDGGAPINSLRVLSIPSDCSVT